MQASSEDETSGRNRPCVTFRGATSLSLRPDSPKDPAPRHHCVHATLPSHQLWGACCQVETWHRHGLPLIAARPHRPVLVRFVSLAQGRLLRWSLTLAQVVCHCGLRQPVYERFVVCGASQSCAPHSVRSASSSASASSIVSGDARRLGVQPVAMRGRHYGSGRGDRPVTNVRAEPGPQLLAGKRLGHTFRRRARTETAPRSSRGTASRRASTCRAAGCTMRSNCSAPDRTGPLRTPSRSACGARRTTCPTSKMRCGGPFAAAETATRRAPSWAGLWRCRRGRCRWSGLDGERGCRAED